VGRHDGAPERIGQSFVDFACDVVERPLLVEAPHIDRPFDRRPGSADREFPRNRAGDRDHAAVDFRRVGRVHRDLGFAGLLALIERRIVEKGKAYGALDLEGAFTGEKHGCGVGVDALNLVPPMGRRIGEEAEHLLLVLRVLAHLPKLLRRQAIRGRCGAAKRLD
jgi:hypothetical protein